MLFYFTATGNSLYVAKQLDADRISIAQAVHDKEKKYTAHQEFLDRAAGMPKEVSGHFYRITDECIGCGICTRVCPKKCFRLDGPKSVWNPEGCMMCMACIHACPMTAIRMRVQEKNPGTGYRNENISICEIVDANNQWREEISG